MRLIDGVSMMVGDNCCGSTNRASIISEDIGSTTCQGKPHRTVPGVDWEVLRIIPAKRTDTNTAKSLFLISNAAMSSISSVAAHLPLGMEGGILPTQVLQLQPGVEAQPVPQKQQ